MVGYDRRWPTSYEHQQQRLSVVLAAWLVRPIDHVGSTSVRGLVAKPIIDMVAVVADIESLDGVGGALSSIGWVAAPEPTDATSREMSFCTPSVQRRTHQLHVVEEASSSWREWIAFRDYLRAHPEMAAEYGALKTRLAAQHGADPNDRDAYRAGKATWIQAVTERALQEQQ
jgi:GrpB-like predicted nucleotidyltransferase (UPF0157 family)